MMKAIVVEQVGSFSLRQIPRTEPGPGEVRVRVQVTGLCRTDLKLVRQGHRDLVLPRVPGEEVVGIVESVGPAVSGIAAGDRVYVYPGKWCGRCSACRKGAENLCTEMQIMGFHRDGGFAEAVTVPAQSVIPLPGGLDAERAVFAEPLSCCLNALELSGLCAGETVGIWGAGPAGTLLSRAAASLGARPFTIEPDPLRRRRIDGLETAGNRLFDVVIPAVGSRSAYEEAIVSMAPRGRMVFFSGLSPADDRIAVSVNRFHYLEQSVVGAYGCCFRHGRAALDLIASEAVPVADLVSHRMALEELDQGLRLVEERGGMKILLFPET